MRCCIIMFFLASSFDLSAQSCGNCHLTPSIAKYDLDVQVPQLSDTGELMFQWKQLFWLGKHATADLFKANKSCVKFVQPPGAGKKNVVTKDGVEIAPLKDQDDIMMVGETYTNLAPAGDLSGNGNYIITGYVKQQGEGYIMHMEIQSACGRKSVAAADIPFQLSALPVQTVSIAQQAAAKLSPLVDKIKKFELEERQNDKKLSLHQTFGEPIRVTPLKSSLKAGESTDINIELKDCDGVPLQGREIFFTETTFEGLKIFGTMGGTVVPAKVITDANGKAKAKFTLKSGAKEAIISAHSPGNEVKGCASMFFGDAAINIRKVYYGFIKYSFDDAADCEESSTSESGVSTNYHSTNNRFKVEYNASFYIDEKGQFSFSGETESSSPATVPNIMENGAMIYKTKEIRRNKVAGNPPNEQVITKDQNGKLKSGSVRFMFDDKLPSVDVDLKFQLQGSSSFKQTYLPSANHTINEEYLHSVGLFGSNLKYTKTAEGGKIKHTFTWMQTISGKCSHKVERMQLQVLEE